MPILFADKRRDFSEIEPYLARILPIVKGALFYIYLKLARTMSTPPRSPRLQTETTDRRRVPTDLVPRTRRLYSGFEGGSISKSPIGEHRPVAKTLNLISSNRQHRKAVRHACRHFGLVI